MLTIKKDIHLIIQSFLTADFCRKECKIQMLSFILQQFENDKHFNHILFQFPFNWNIFLYNQYFPSLGIRPYIYATKPLKYLHNMLVQHCWMYFIRNIFVWIIFVSFFLSFFAYNFTRNPFSKPCSKHVSCITRISNSYPSTELKCN